MSRPRRRRLPDPRVFLRSFASALPGLGWLLAPALAAWAWRPPTLAERVERIEAEVRAMEADPASVSPPPRTPGTAP